MINSYPSQNEYGMGVETPFIMIPFSMITPINEEEFSSNNQNSHKNNCNEHLEINKSSVAKEAEASDNNDFQLNHSKEEVKTPEVSISDEIIQQSKIDVKEEIKEVSKEKKQRRRKHKRKRFIEELRTYNKEYYEIHKPNRGRKSIICKFEDCGKSFKRVQNFVIHLRVHLDVKHYE